MVSLYSSSLQSKIKSQDLAKTMTHLCLCWCLNSVFLSNQKLKTSRSCWRTFMFLIICDIILIHCGGAFMSLFTLISDCRASGS